MVNKFDVWRGLVGDLNLEGLQPYAKTRDGVIGVNQSIITEVSERIRELLSKTSPEIVAACESFCNEVTYIPVSPQGCAAEVNPDSDGAGFAYGVRPENLKPIWAEIPLMFAISRTKCSLVPAVIKTS